MLGRIEGGGRPAREGLVAPPHGGSIKRSRGRRPGAEKSRNKGGNGVVALPHFPALLSSPPVRSRCPPYLYAHRLDLMGASKGLRCGVGRGAGRRPRAAIHSGEGLPGNWGQRRNQSVHHLSTRVRRRVRSCQVLKFISRAPRAAHSLLASLGAADGPRRTPVPRPRRPLVERGVPSLKKGGKEHGKRGRLNEVSQCIIMA